MKFHENLSSESRAVLCGRAEGHTEKNEEAHTGFSQFCESALKPTGSSNYTCKIPQYCTTPISRNSPTNSCTPPRLDSHSHTHHHYTTTTTTPPPPPQKSPPQPPPNRPTTTTKPLHNNHHHLHYQNTPPPPKRPTTTAAAAIYSITFSFTTHLIVQWPILELIICSGEFNYCSSISHYKPPRLPSVAR